MLQEIKKIQQLRKQKGHITNDSHAKANNPSKIANMDELSIGIRVESSPKPNEIRDGLYLCRLKDMMGEGLAAKSKNFISEGDGPNSIFVNLDSR